MNRNFLQTPPLDSDLLICAGFLHQTDEVANSTKRDFVNRELDSHHSRVFALGQHGASALSDDLGLARLDVVEQIRRVLAGIRLRHLKQKKN
jgi:hypothetical protein